MPKREFDREYEQLTLQGNPLLSDHTVADIETDKKTVRRERPRLSSNAKAIRKEKAADWKRRSQGNDPFNCQLEY